MASFGIKTNFGLSAIVDCEQFVFTINHQQNIRDQFFTLAYFRQISLKIKVRSILLHTRSHHGCIQEGKIEFSFKFPVPFFDSLIYTLVFLFLSCVRPFCSVCGLPVLHTHNKNYMVQYKVSFVLFFEILSDSTVGFDTSKKWLDSNNGFLGPFVTKIMYRYISTEVSDNIHFWNMSIAIYYQSGIFARKYVKKN